MSETVTVALKCPLDIDLRLHEFRTISVPLPGGGTRDERQAFPTGDKVRIKGYRAEAGKNPTSGAELSLGFALTPGVSAKFWDQWLEQNKEHDLVLNGLIFAHAHTQSVKSQTRENEDRWDGLQPVSQKNETRMPKRRDGMKIEPAAAA